MVVGCIEIVVVGIDIVAAVRRIVVAAVVVGYNHIEVVVVVGLLGRMRRTSFVSVVVNTLL